MAKIEIRNVTKSFGPNQILKKINLEVQSGEFLVLVGPSGCGKSTLLRSLAGLEKIDSGEILVDGKLINDIEPQNRNIAMVFQNYALYPHMNVFENMAFALRLQKQPDGEIKKRVQEISELLQITALLERKPKELSGGQRQRVALGRALTRKSPVILFDEPLSNLDAHLRSQMRVEIKRLHQALKSTMIYVTHDQMEATTMGDRIAVMREGLVEQLGTPTEIYHRPKNLFIATFIGSPEMNLIEGSLVQKIPAAKNSRDFVLGIRPEAFRVSRGSLQDGEIELGGFQVDLSENLGGHQMLHGKLDQQNVRILVDSLDKISNGQVIPLKIDLTKAHLFDKKSGLHQSL